MSLCQLSGLRKLKGRRHTRERSRVTARNIIFFHPNLQKRTFQTSMGRISLNICNRVARTILNKYGGILENYLVSVKRGHLSDEGKKLRQKFNKTNII